MRRVSVCRVLVAAAVLLAGAAVVQAGPVTTSSEQTGRGTGHGSPFITWMQGVVLSPGEAVLNATLRLDGARNGTADATGHAFGFVRDWDSKTLRQRRTSPADDDLFWNAENLPATPEDFGGEGAPLEDLRFTDLRFSDAPPAPPDLLSDLEAVPEPATVTLFGLGVAGIAAMVRRRKR